jgi:hypothetical protein
LYRIERFIFHACIIIIPAALQYMHDCMHRPTKIINMLLLVSPRPQTMPMVNIIFIKRQMKTLYLKPKKIRFSSLFLVDLIFRYLKFFYDDIYNIIYLIYLI